jgi:diguanylate cyclase (GGDEF)-like protein/PAS domain S-box-containing protein
MPRLSIYLLGSFQVRLNDQIISAAFRTEKERALLTFLAVESERPHPREAIAELFWPERPEGVARTNLRQALLGVRRTLGDRVSETPFLKVSDESITFNTEKNYWLDTAAFHSRFQFTLTHPHKDPETCPTCAQQLQEAIDLYRDDFLSEMSLPDSHGFQEWVLFHREQYFRNLLAALHNLSAYYQYLGDYDLAHKYAWRQVNLAPLEESAHRRLMQLLALSGRRSAALEQYHDCRRILAEELRIEPAPETTMLYEQIRSGSPFEKTRPIRATHASGLPLQFTSFVGRETELAWFERCLPNPVCRLLTVVGMAGAGKTRLAIEAASFGRDLFADGVRFLALQDAQPGDPLATSLVRLLGLPSQTREDPRTHLFRFLGPLKTLLVIDHFDSYGDETGLLLEILKNAPDVKLLVTSRVHLHFQAACSLSIRGLAYPSETEAKKTESYAAVQLFLARAERSRTGFILNEANLQQIVQICQLLDGLPLGIELAASRLRDFTCAQILQELRRGLDILQTSLQDVPKRHRGLRLAIQPSWEGLSPEEQEHFRRLSIFRDGFTPEGAQEVCSVPRDALAALCDKSLLYSGTSRRYMFQPLVQRFAREKLDAFPQEAEQLSDQHCNYYLNFLRQREASFFDEQERSQAMNEIDADTENIRTALAHASSQRKVAMLAKGIVTLNRYYQMREASGRQAIPSDADGVLYSASLDTLALPIIDDTLSEAGWCCGRAGRFEDANDAILLTDKRGNILDANYQACQLTGHTRAALQQMKMIDLMLEDLPSLGSSESQHFELPMRRANGIQMAIEISTSPMEENGEVHYLTILREIEAPDGHTLQLTGENWDPLTQLPNRTCFKDLAQRAISQAARDARQMAILLLDVDDFKAFNQIYGQDKGNLLLQAVAERLKAGLRCEDHLARIGGDEFAILVENIPRMEVVGVIAEKILQKLRLPVAIEEQEISITASIGIGIYPDSGDNLESLMKSADEAKDRVKERGKNGYYLMLA